MDQKLQKLEKKLEELLFVDGRSLGERQKDYSKVSTEINRLRNEKKALDK